jgi:hypothetical protein
MPCFLVVGLAISVGSVGPDILVDIMSKFRPVEMSLQHCHYLFYAEVSYHPTVVGFPKSSSLARLMECRDGPDGTTTHPKDGN